MLKDSFSEFVSDRVAVSLIFSECNNPQWQSKNQEVNGVFVKIQSQIPHKLRERMDRLAALQNQLCEIACADCYYQGFRDALKIFAGM
ncbi:MAG: hypothetical protein IJQ57_11955 [Synergistaceae bacterium]|nr:hypothetical protein [Synergistaceae bacterium]